MLHLLWNVLRRLFTRLKTEGIGFKLYPIVMEENVLRKEILLQGYYGIGNWLRKVRFEEELSRDKHAMNDIDRMADYCYPLLVSMLFEGQEPSAEYIILPQLCSWLETKYPDKFDKSKWIRYTEEMVHDKLSMAQRKTFPNEEPIWCDALAEIILKHIGRKCSEDSRFQNIGWLEKTLDEETLPWEFFEGFTVANEVYSEAEEKIEVNPQEILGGSRMIEMPLAEYEVSDKTTEEILKELHRYEEYGGYVEMPSIITMLAKYYLQANIDAAFIALWKKLSHPILQYSLLFYISTLPEDCLRLLKLLKREGIDEVGLTLVRDFWFRQSVRCLENLLQYEQNKEGKDPYVAEITPFAEKVRADFEDSLDDASWELLKYFTAENLTRWAYAMNTLGDKPDSIYKKAYLTVLNTLKTALDTATDVDAFSLDTKDMSYLLYLAEKAIVDKEIERCKKIEDVVLNLIDSGKFGWFGGVNQDVVNEMCILAALLNTNHNHEEIVSLVKSRAVRYEGWAVTPMSEMNERMNTAAFLIGAALMVEADDTYFKAFARFVMEQVNGCDAYNKVFNASLIIAELIATQPHPEWRDWYETALLQELESFETLIMVLSQAKEPMSPLVKTLYEKRKQEELGVMRIRYNTTHRKMELNRLEKMMAKVEGLEP